MALSCLAQNVTPSADEISSRRLGGWPMTLPTTGPIGVISFIRPVGIARFGAFLSATRASVSISLAHRRDLAAEDVGLAGYALVEREQDAGGDVLHVDHVHAEVGEGDHGHPAVEKVGHLLAKRRVVLGAVDPRRLDDHARQALLGDQALRDLVRLVLGLLVVGREARARVLVALVHDLAVGVPVGADRRDVDDLSGLFVECRAEHVLGAEDVGLVHGPVFGVGDARPRRWRRRG